MVPLQLANGVVIADGVAVLSDKFEAFRWDWYDGVCTAPDRIEPVDFAITIAMNSRATAGRMAEFMKIAAAVEERLRQIPRDLHLGDFQDGDKVWVGIQSLFEVACAALGTKLSVASKILHRKRPHLIPILDKVVVDKHYWPALVALQEDPPGWYEAAWLKHGSFSDPTMYMRVMRGEICDNRENLGHIRSALEGQVPDCASDVRLLEAALYRHLITMGVNSSQPESR